MTIDRVRLFIAAHDGVITAAQALALGMSRSAIQRRRESGDWLTVVRGTFMAADHPWTPRARMRVAVLAVGGSATLAGSAAAWWHGLVNDFPSQISVITPAHGRHLRTPVGVQVRHRALDPADVVELDGLQVTAVPMTILDAAAESGSRVIDNALLRRRSTLAELSRAHARNIGRRGAAENGRLLEALQSGARSEAERLTVRLFRRHGITGWIANHPVCGAIADFVFVEARLIVEIDGFAFHRDAQTFQRDRTKRNTWIAAGWATLNFTWDDLTRRAESVVSHVRIALP